MREIYLLNNISYDGIINLPVFKINFLKTTLDLNSYDALVFTSKNAVCSMQYFDSSWIKIPSYSIALKTSQQLLNLGSNLAFTGKSGHGNDFANELIPILKNKKVLYISAKKTVSNLFLNLKKSNINVNKIITYETISNDKIDINIKKNSIIIFSSPSSVEYFFSNYSWCETFLAIVIGKTTAKYLPQNISYLISETTSLDSCIKLAKSQ